MSASFGQSGNNRLPFVVKDADEKDVVSIIDSDPENPEESTRTLRIRGTTPRPPPEEGEDPHLNQRALEYVMDSPNSGGGQNYTIHRRDGSTQMFYQVDSSHLIFNDANGTPIFDLDPDGRMLRLSNASGNEMVSFVGSNDPEVDQGDVRFGPGTTLTLTNYIDLPVRTDDPDPPPADTIRLYARVVGEQTIFFARFGPDGDPVQIVAS
jgi:hypothetical protein